ncbi:MAG: methylated-DNA--[protein]-cysteine S-methyltransferase [Sporomusaceae bacterium]|nr:methylated-DNA--[protein]-cysteine S-methyltransferase [Sporomusaceae bacterium]
MYAVSLHDTAWGYVAAAWSAAGLWELSFPEPTPQTAQTSLLSPVTYTAANAAVAGLDRELRAYFAGERIVFATPVDWSGYSPFRAAVLRYTALIPYGEVRTYGEAAAAAGSPRGSRAAGGALHNNRTPIIIPCHRVLGATGVLVGFGGGLERKAALLKLEQGINTVRGRSR